MQSTAHESYTHRLVALERAWWRRILDPQIPYRWYLKRLSPGFTLEVGCGLGRNLLNNSGLGVGLDHNPTTVTHARNQGLTAFTPEEFMQSAFCGDAAFDSLLLAHVIEHMTFTEAIELVRQHLVHVKKGGKLILICPQKAGFENDTTHVEYFDLQKMRQIAQELNLTVHKATSFPFPPWVGHVFTYNEWVLVASKPLI